MMKLVSLLLTVLLVCLIFAAIGAPIFAAELPADPRSPEGIWNGKLSVQGTDLRIVFKIVRKGDSLTATLDSPDQSAKDIPADTVTFAANTLNLTIKAIGFSYTGKMNDAGSEITGTMTQGAANLPLDLKRGAIAENRRPQDPVRPYPYLEEEVSYPNPKAPGVTLAGTLTLPRGDGRFPAVLLITGSGAQDRDEALMGHRPFLVLADALTRRGIAVLRVDDRGTAKSTGDFKTATTADFADDVRAGVAFLKKHAKIDPAQIGLIGHSEGGLIAPMVAAQSHDIAFIVMMAGPGVNGDAILYEQGKMAMRAAGAPEEAIAKNSALQKQILDLVKAEPDPAVAAMKLKAIADAEVAKLPAPQRSNPNLAAQIHAQIESANTPWMRYFLTYDPAPALKKVTCPVLAIGGEKDVQVPVKQNLPAIEAALKAGGNKDFTVKELPGLNHLFQTATTGGPQEYGVIAETIAPLALRTMGDWIVAHTHAPK